MKKFVGEVLQNGFLLHFFSGIGNNGEENKKKKIIQRKAENLQSRNKIFCLDKRRVCYLFLQC